MQYDVPAELAAAYGLDLELVRGGQLGPYAWQRDPYVVRALPDTDLVPLLSLRVSRWLNFGNMVAQLTAALMFADKHQITIVTGPENPWFTPGTAVGVRLRFHGKTRPPALSGRFFYKPVLGLSGPVPVPVIEALRERFALRPVAPEHSRDLVVHLRSGDVFGDDPHPDYWPPSLAYYQAVIEAEGPAHVTVVAQDHVHPGLEPLVAWCRARGIVAEVQVGSLAEDLAALTAGRTLCLSMGTMGLSAAWLAPYAERVYVPSVVQVQELLGLGVRVWSADLPGSGQLGPWTASAEQRSALLAPAGVSLRELDLARDCNQAGT